MQAIEAWLARHPSAADTEQGIHDWWLPDIGVDVPRSDLRLALDALVQQGRLQRDTLPDGSAVYRAPAPSSSP